MAFTYFYRDVFTLNHAISTLLSKKQNNYKVWDAGCAMGPEAYTFALMILDKYGEDIWQKIDITATDLDPHGYYLSTLVNGIYSQHDVSRVPQHLLSKYFFASSNSYEITDLIKSRLKSFQHNLLHLTPPDNNFDLIICKNVLLHFTPIQRIAVIKMFYKSLKPNGIFISEHTQKMPIEVEHKFLRLKKNAQLWVKK